jgi:hypothetical protein
MKRNNRGSFAELSDAILNSELSASPGKQATVLSADEKKAMIRQAAVLLEEAAAKQDEALSILENAAVKCAHGIIAHICAQLDGFEPSEKRGVLSIVSEWLEEQP